MRGGGGVLVHAPSGDIIEMRKLHEGLEFRVANQTNYLTRFEMEINELKELKNSMRVLSSQVNERTEELRDAVVILQVRYHHRKLSLRHRP